MLIYIKFNFNYWAVWFTDSYIYIFKSIFYSLKINSDQKKNVVSKDAKGDPKIFEIQVLIDLTILENNKIKHEKKFKESYVYNNSTNKFDLNHVKIIDDLLEATQTDEQVKLAIMSTLLNNARIKEEDIKKKRKLN